VRFFYKPTHGVVGDCIPYYFDGRYHVFYLRDYRDVDSCGIGSAWHHVSTTDFVHFEDHGEALSKAAVDEQDVTVATGCVYTDPSGKHHIYYTGINPYFRTDTQREQALLHATSDDLITWTKAREEVWYADEAIYERHDWRDPFIFRNPDTGRYNMIVAARSRRGSTAHRGCTGLLTSDDLTTWTVDEPFYAPGRYHGHECPDLFRMGDWYYLVFSEYTTRTATRYVMSRSVGGPWIEPNDNQFDNRAFYAAKTAGDGNRRFLFGWNPSKVGSVDDGVWRWGGCLTVHEVLQNGDGTLSVRMPPEAQQAFAEPIPLDLDCHDANWTHDGTAYRVVSPYAYTAVLGEAMPETYQLEGELSFESNTGAAGILLGVMQDGDGGYFLRFSPGGHVLQFGKVGGYRPWYVDHMPELDRPLEIHAGTTLHYKIIVDKSALVAYVGDRVALSGRMYAQPFGRCGLFADGTAVSFTRFESRAITV